ncbi:hypothetical protein HDU97_003899 [Phlyctochytrium planicorne]|nr:hypothetical protein HDU97_003899 [Phlyctochytrium planicorne]
MTSTSTLNFKKAKTDTQWTLSEKAKNSLPDELTSALASRPMKIRQAVAEGYKIKPKQPILNLSSGFSTTSTVTQAAFQPRGLTSSNSTSSLPLNTLKRTRSDAEDLERRK